MDGFLTDQEFVAGLKAEQKLVKHHKSDAIASWNGSDSQIQPSSIDLYPKVFFTPDRSEGSDAVVLPPGGAVVYCTKEELDLPDDIMGFVFTPTHLSMQGFFSPSIGHIDPGFKGVLRQVGINMGGSELKLSCAQKVATVVLFRLAKAASHGYATRAGSSTPADSQKILKTMAEAFAKDFGNFREVAAGQADKAVNARLESLNTAIDRRLMEHTQLVESRFSALEQKVASDVNSARDDLRSARDSLWPALVVGLVAVPVITVALQLMSSYIAHLLERF